MLGAPVELDRAALPSAAITSVARSHRLRDLAQAAPFPATDRVRGPDSAAGHGEERRMLSGDEVTELRGEIVALETALAAAFGEIAALRAAVTGGGAKGAEQVMDAMAADLEGSVLRGIVLAEAAGQASAAAGFERRM